MKRDKKIVLLTFLSCGMSLFLGCDSEMPDYYNERVFELENFEGVQLGDAFQIEIIQSEDFQVIAKGEDRDLNNLILEVNNGILVGSYRPGSSNHKRTLLQISMPVLRMATLRDASSTQITGFNDLEESLNLKVSGASRVVTNTDWKSMEVEVNGASEVVFEGEAEDLKATINGSSRFQAVEFITNNTIIFVNGASEATITALEKLSGEVNGHSLLRYNGDPQIIEVEVATDSRMMKL